MAARLLRLNAELVEALAAAAILADHTKAAGQRNFDRLGAVGLRAFENCFKRRIGGN